MIAEMIAEMIPGIFAVTVAKSLVAHHRAVMRGVMSVPLGRLAVHLAAGDHHLLVVATTGLIRLILLIFWEFLVCLKLPAQTSWIKCSKNMVRFQKST